MKLGELCNNICLSCGKGVFPVKGVWVHTDYDFSHRPTVKEKLKLSRKMRLGLFLEKVGLWLQGSDIYWWIEYVEGRQIKP